jgi:hypothetical protein
VVADKHRRCSHSFGTPWRFWAIIRVANGFRPTWAFSDS